VFSLNTKHDKDIKELLVIKYNVKPYKGRHERDRIWLVGFTKPKVYLSNQCLSPLTL
jgi:hypothetical protein